MIDKVCRIKSLIWHQGIGSSLVRTVSVFGLIEVWVTAGHFLWAPADREGFGRPRECDSIDHGCELAQAWYVERIAPGLEEVPDFSPHLRTEVKNLLSILTECQRAINGDCGFPYEEIEEVLGG